MINTKRLYTVASVNGVSHREVRDYIWQQWELVSTKELNDEQFNSLINYLDKGKTEMAEEKERSIGAIWVKEGKSGKYMSISLEINGVKQSFVAFKNDYKTEDKHPNYKIFPSKHQSQPTEVAQSNNEAPKDDSEGLPF